MIPALANKVVRVIDPAAIVDNASFTSRVVDTLGFDYCRINVYLGATDVDFTAMKVQESDVKASDTALTGGADVPGAVASGTTGDTRIPQDDDDNKIFSFFIDCRGRKRFFDLVLTIGDGTVGGFATAWAELSRAKEGPRTAAEQGLGGRFIV